MNRGDKAYLLSMLAWVFAIGASYFWPEFGSLFFNVLILFIVLMTICWSKRWLIFK